LLACRLPPLAPGLISFLLAEALLSLQILSIAYSLLPAYALANIYAPETLA
jgi:hypothetical protein